MVLPTWSYTYILTSISLVCPGDLPSIAHAQHWRQKSLDCEAHGAFPGFLVSEDDTLLLIQVFHTFKIQNLYKLDSFLPNILVSLVFKHIRQICCLSVCSHAEIFQTVFWLPAASVCMECAVIACCCCCCFPVVMAFPLSWAQVCCSSCNQDFFLSNFSAVSTVFVINASCSLYISIAFYSGAFVYVSSHSSFILVHIFYKTL